MSATTLYAFPFAGGSATAYADLDARLGPGVSLRTLELPGRGRRFAEPLLTSLEDMVTDLLEQMAHRFRPPYAIFGHSLGACLGYLVTRRLVEAGLPPPARLFLSGLAGLSTPRDGPPRHTLSSDAFREMLRRFGGLPAEVLADASAMSVFEPILRADFRAFEAYEHPERSAPLDVPMHVLLGDSDHIDEAAALRWARESARPLAMSWFPGGHFYFHEQGAAVAALIERELFKCI